MEMLVRSQEIVKHAIPWPFTCRHLPALCCKTVLQQKSLISCYYDFIRAMFPFDINYSVLRNDSTSFIAEMFSGLSIASVV